MNTISKTPPKKSKKQPKTGLCCIYLRHEEGFHEPLRPAYDTAPTARLEMTNKEVRTLVGMIHRYMFKCSERRGK